MTTLGMPTKSGFYSEYDHFTLKLAI